MFHFKIDQADCSIKTGDYATKTLFTWGSWGCAPGASGGRAEDATLVCLPAQVATDDEDGAGQVAEDDQRMACATVTAGRPGIGSMQSNTSVCSTPLPS